MSLSVEVLSRAGNGWDAIDREAATKHGIKVIRQEGAYSDPVADTTVAYILALARQIVPLNDSMHAGFWKRQRYPGIALYEATVGVIGLGNIGREVCKRLMFFGNKLLIHRPTQLLDKVTPLEYLLEESDFVTLHLKLCEDTHHFIGEKELNMMKPTAYLINTSRGGLVDTDALVKALFNKKIAGAALDVFEEEPLPENHMLRMMNNVLLAPHNSYWSPVERKWVVRQAIQDARELIND